jgi:hypothetical protein
MPSGVGIALNRAQRPACPSTIDVTFPGENEPDQVDAWISAYAEPFYIRS